MRRVAELLRADRLLPDMPETLYALGKAASLEGDNPAAEKAWTKLLSIEKQSSLAAQAHFGLAGIYRKQGKTAEAKREMQEFQSLQNNSAQPQPAAQQPESATLSARIYLGATDMELIRHGFFRRFSVAMSYFVGSVIFCSLAALPLQGRRTVVARFECRLAVPGRRECRSIRRERVASGAGSGSCADGSVEQ